MSRFQVILGFAGVRDFETWPYLGPKMVILPLAYLNVTSDLDLISQDGGKQNKLTNRCKDPCFSSVQNPGYTP